MGEAQSDMTPPPLLVARNRRVFPADRATVVDVDRRRAIVVALVSLLAIAAVWFFFLRRSDDEAVIRAQIDRLARAVQVDPQESLLARRARVQGELDDVLTKDVSFDVPELTDQHSDRAALVGVATQAAAIWSTADVSISDVRVTLSPSKKNATVTATATLVGTRRDGGQERDRRAVGFELRVDDGWRISAIHVSPRQE